MKPTRLLLKEITLNNGVGLNELQRQGLESFIDRIIKESYNEAIDAAIKTCCVQVDMSDREFTSKESLERLKKK